MKKTTSMYSKCKKLKKQNKNSEKWNIVDLWKGVHKVVYAMNTDDGQTLNLTDKFWQKSFKISQDTGRI